MYFLHTVIFATCAAAPLSVDAQAEPWDRQLRDRNVVWDRNLVQDRKLVSAKDVFALKRSKPSTLLRHYKLTWVAASKYRIRCVPSLKKQTIHLIASHQNHMDDSL